MADVSTPCFSKYSNKRLNVNISQKLCANLSTHLYALHMFAHTSKSQVQPATKIKRITGGPFSCWFDFGPIVVLISLCTDRLSAFIELSRVIFCACATMMTRCVVMRLLHPLYLFCDTLHEAAAATVDCFYCCCSCCCVASLRFVCRIDLRCCKTQGLFFLLYSINSCVSNRIQHSTAPSVTHYICRVTHCKNIVHNAVAVHHRMQLCAVLCHPVVHCKSDRILHTPSNVL